MTRKKVMMKPMGTGLIVAGVVLIVLGLLFKLGWLSWFGRLPGDFSHEGENVSFYFPLASMLVVSALLTLLLFIFRHFR
jgi:membrane protein implicated in regulation of membrane protease activity